MSNCNQKERRIRRSVTDENKLQQTSKTYDDLMRAAEISSSVATKLNKNETVSLDVLMRICKVFHCDIGDVCEVILDED